MLFTEEQPGGGPLRMTLAQDKLDTPENAIIEIYRRLRPGDPPTAETATTFFNNLFFNPERYDLSKVGRLKLNHKLKIDVPLEQGTLRREDILEVVRYLVDLKDGNGQIDDIDHLGNRRVRAVGELVENQFRIGLVRMERAIKERMCSAGHRNPDAAGAGELQTGVRRHQGVFRLVAALAVHGSDQSAVARSRTSAGSRRSDPAV